ncbi:hypothetical protein IWX90DRAFT_134441 [Phyllosticta citrichinensis]|uniref:Tetratricopeptide SHNi-TPR domain-containing protein n=1 Tax=Phyllosticta citrichinensis TaxID=1130410 RepID=A0ABR1XEN9_9PEZI
MATLETIRDKSDHSQDKLSALLAAAELQYRLKNYDEAADIYSKATEVQVQLNGEMAPENAELYFRYGRCLYKVAVAKSDVLGGRVASEEKPAKKPKKQQKNGDGNAKAEEALPGGEQKLAEEVVEAVVEENVGKADSNDQTVENKPFFQITGDENWDTESDEEDEEAEADALEEEDDFSNAYEILDVARCLLEKQLEALQTSARDTTGDKGKGKGPAKELDPEERKVLEKLAETRHLQAEIGLENENFVEAVNDFRAALDIKQKLYPEESSVIAEGHYFLSLALEFGSMTEVRKAQAQAEANGGKVNPKDAKVDEDMRADAAAEMEKAIASCNLRITKTEAELPNAAPEEAADLRQRVLDVKEMVKDMEDRLAELRAPAISLSAPSNPAGAPDASNPIAGVLSELLGQPSEQERKELEGKLKGASDISSLIKRKKPAPAANGGDSAAKPADAAASAGSKRKNDDAEMKDAAADEAKKAKVDES